ncbi:LexA family transcriptional regulator [Achromobacter xylosoxidans]
MPKPLTTLEPWQAEDAKRLYALFKERATLSQMAFGAAHEIGNQSMVSQYLLGRRPLNIDAVRKFADGLGCPIDEISPTLAMKIAEASGRLSAQQDGAEFIPIRRLDVRLSAGRGQLFTSDEEKSRLSFRADFLQSIGATPDNTVSVSVTGDSMEPVIPDGSTLLVDRGNRHVVNGKVYALRQDGSLLVKRLYKAKEGYVARSDNATENYPDIPLDEEHPDFEIIGRAVWVGFKL